MLDLDEMKALRDDIRHWPGGTAHRVVKALTALIEEVERLRELMSPEPCIEESEE